MRMTLNLSFFSPYETLIGKARLWQQLLHSSGRAHAWRSKGRGDTNNWESDKARTSKNLYNWHWFGGRELHQERKINIIRNNRLKMLFSFPKSGQLRRETSPLNWLEINELRPVPWKLKELVFTSTKIQDFFQNTNVHKSWKIQSYHPFLLVVSCSWNKISRKIVLDH